MSLVAILVGVGGLMWRKKMKEAEEQQGEFEAKSDEWEKKLVFNEDSSAGEIDKSNFGIDGT